MVDSRCLFVRAVAVVGIVVVVVVDVAAVEGRCLHSTRDFVATGL